MLAKASKGSLLAQQTIAKYSMFSVPPVFLFYPTVGVQASVDIYAIFRIKPMHLLATGLSRKLNKCFVS